MAPTIINCCWSILGVCGGSTLISHRMGSTGIRLALLLWFLGHLEAQTGVSSCGSPELTNGYFVPEEESYDQGAQIFYTCEKGHKPTAEGWWATSLCRDGTWSPKPQCINENACLPPEIPNAVFSPSGSDWYQHGRKIRTTCNKGFEHQRFDATTVCVNGSWSTKPVCTKSAGACGEPPQVLHAAVVNRGPLEVFPEDSQVQYQCKDGYVMEGNTDVQKFVYCIGGKWTEAPTCTALCVLDPVKHHRNDFKLSKVEYLGEGEEKSFSCIWVNDLHTVIARCKKGEITFSRCCRPHERYQGICA